MNKSTMRRQSRTSTKKTQSTKHTAKKSQARTVTKSRRSITTTTTRNAPQLFNPQFSQPLPTPLSALTTASSSFTTSIKSNQSSSTKIIQSASFPINRFALKPQKHFFSTTPEQPAQIPDVYVGDEEVGENETRLPFSVKDAILIKESLIDGIKDSTSIKDTLSHLGTAHINSMLKQTQIENILGQATLEVIQQLAQQGKIHLPDIGAGTIAAQNFNTLYSLLQIQDGTGKLKELYDEQWCVVMELTFGTDQVVTRNVTISDAAAIKIASEYRRKVSTSAFKKEVAERMSSHPIPPGGNPMQVKLAHELRQMEISNIVAPILEEIYGQYQFDGDEGFCLMKKAMEQHISNGEVVQLLNEAQKHIIDASGLDQHVLLDID